MGQSHRHRLDTHPRRIHLNPTPCPNETKDPPALESPHTRRDTGRIVMPACNNQPHKPAGTGESLLGVAACKIEANRVFGASDCSLSEGSLIPELAEILGIANSTPCRWDLT